MLNTNAEDTMLEFPMTSSKPGHYSDKEIPRVPTLTRQLASPSQKTESCAEKLYQICTSLPVSSALLAAVSTQGVPVGGSLWYLNYTAILVILLTSIAVVISYLSATASHSYCETIFLTIYTPFSQICNLSVSLQDVHPMEGTSRRTSRTVTPTWLKQLLFVCIALSATRGLSIISVMYAICVIVIYSGLATLLSKCIISSPQVMKKVNVSVKDCLAFAAFAVAISADVFVTGSVGFMNLIYFLLTNITVISSVKLIVENFNVEIMEGLEQYYTQGLLQLAEIVLTLLAIAFQPSLCLLYIPVFYYCIYLPIEEFKATVRTINAESMCLSTFETATAADIDHYDDVCAVCLSSMTHARITPCKHIFHGKCLKDCLQKKAQCPMCNCQML